MSKKVTLTLYSEGQNAVSIEKNTAHSRNPLLDQLEIIAEAIGGLLEGKSSFSQSELRSLAHIRQMTRMHKQSPESNSYCESNVYECNK